jgi:4-amino-4-deoxy-L-arabinose transferase-like glycosyltransferase
VESTVARDAVERPPALRAWLDWRLDHFMLAALCAATFIVFMRTEFVLDLPLMHYVAWRVNEGDAPYVDIWDMNGPAAYMAHQLMLMVPLAPQLVVSLVMVGLTAMCAVAATMIASRGGRRWLGFAAGAAMVVAIAGRGGDFLAQRDMMIAALAAVSLALMTARGARLWRWCVAGVLIGLAVGVKPTAAPFALFAVGAAVWIDLGEGRSFRRMTWLAAGGAAGAAVWVTYLLATGSFAGWWQTMTGYNAAYMKIAREPLLALLAEPTVALATAGGMACLFVAKTRRRAGAGRDQVASLVMTAAFAIASAAMYHIQGKGWVYQVAPATVMAVISTGMAIAALAYRPKAWMIAGAVVGVTLFSLNGLRSQFSPEHARLQADRAGIAGEMAAALNALPAGMTVQPLDTTDGALNAMTQAKRAPASPVMYDFFLFLGDETDIAQARGVVLDAARRGDSAFLITNGGWPDFQTGFARIREFKELQAILDARYRLVSAGHRGPYDFRLFAPAE